ncbi:hypothetical protein K491DRAFT_674945 [Lophiostoma macrostomum CBS 122681]|uniref:CID domain-containing protein n=1 Tax=Lophiostoma macrostomum CBS 122681 TaxID=1314788 RepID=A0A6A6TNJ6_9PLEO|nr:hypothetical protein K491DRAFT_674945 [Lophiostoma macrostomum CBS 122681]
MSLTSDEVAADFKDALLDLKVNSRPEISNLTIIAKENTEHAEAISRELENHIRTIRPEWKLPALYVLDSIVKNVGTPYTVYLGRNLYRTFMDAYTLMDPGNRRAMEGLLRTWKQPVPESLDKRPVFDSNVTRDIENALIKFRTVAQQALSQRQVLPHGLPPRPQTNPMANGPWRNTPTPPQNMPRYAAPNDPRIRQPFPSTPQYGQYPVSATPPIQYPAPISSVDLENLKAELSKIITNTKTAWALSPSDVSIQTKLKALLDLETVLKTQTLPPQQLEAVRNQIQALSPSPAPLPFYAPPPSIAPAVPTPQQAAPFPPASTPVNIAQLLASIKPPPTPQQSSTPTISTPSLADMLRRVSTPTQASSTPTAMPPFFAPPFSAPPQAAPSLPQAAPPPAPTPVADLASLLAQFTKPAGTPAVAHAPPPQPAPLPQFPPPQIGAPPASGAPDWLLNALKAMPNLPVGNMPIQTPPIGSEPMTRQVSATATASSGIELTTASMKQPRLHLVSRLYEAYPNLCATCGRRFESTPQGREKKARHMDWHFKVKDPDAAKRGIHRSWYIGEKEWIEYREVDEAAPEQNVNGNGGPVAAAKKDPKDKYVPVPADTTLAHAPCPICQEKFDPTWNVEANDFVWMDALKVNGKIYHATCWEEYSKGSGIVAPSTPDSVLGKRKAELASPASGKKVRAF